MLALATDRVTVLYTGRGIAKLEAMGPAEVLAKYGVPAVHYADFAVLRGDPSDGLPGVPGVGEKTAAALVNRFGAVEEIVAAAQAGDDGFPAGSAGKVRAAHDYLAVAPAAVRGRIDVPLDVIDDRLYPEPRDAGRLDELAGDAGDPQLGRAPDEGGDRRLPDQVVAFVLVLDRHRERLAAGRGAGERVAVVLHREVLAAVAVDPRRVQVAS